MTASTGRPKLGELEPGQPVMVYRSMNDQRGRTPEQRYIPAKVVKANRVWIELEGTDGTWKRTWRMRRDTQHQGTQYPGSNDSFATLDQHQWYETRRWAMSVLRDAGIDLRPNSPWRGREIELADLISKAATKGDAR